MAGYNLARASASTESLSQIGSVSLGAQDTLIKPLGLSQASMPAQRATVYTVRSGDTVYGLARRFGVSIESLAWANGLTATSIQHLKTGQKLWIPATNGVLYTTAKGDTVTSIAQRFHVSMQSILAYNLFTNPGVLPPGTKIMVPGATEKLVNWIQAPAPPAPTAPPPAPTGYSQVTGGYTSAPPGPWPNHFYFGQCTWYVATLRYIPWFGNAWQWYGNAQAYGYPVGQRPEVGSIMVTWESSYGHVAYVEAVYPDGSWLVSEMNYVGWDMVDTRHIYPGQVPLIGFIYQ